MVRAMVVFVCSIALYLAGQALSSLLDERPVTQGNLGRAAVVPPVWNPYLFHCTCLAILCFSDLASKNAACCGQWAASNRLATLCPSSSGRQRCLRSAVGEIASMNMASLSLGGRMSSRPPLRPTEPAEPILSHSIPSWA